MAQDAGLDLVEIGSDQRPPLCKIMDYGKYKYELSKKQQRSRAASKQAEMKEVRLGRSAKIDIHDVMIRVNQARKFLMDGHKVLLVQQFRGREMAHREIGTDRLKMITKELADIAKVETPQKQMGRRMSLILAPDKAKIESIKRKLEAAKVAEAKEKAPAEIAESAPVEAPQVDAPQVDAPQTENDSQDELVTEKAQSTTES